jgi:hypothetical protein
MARGAGGWGVCGTGGDKGYMRVWMRGERRTEIRERIMVVR